jgi:branched-chain amino acid transport system permease protein
MISARSIGALFAVALLAAFPLALQALDQTFYIGFASRILIYGVAATSLNLILGNAGMVSFGHAAFLGTGAYTVGILSAEGIASGWLAWPLAILVSALAALLIGAVSLRTRGVYFIMITLAFAQMIYYVFVSLKAYGGDDGLNVVERSQFGFGLDVKNELTWYYICAVVLMTVLYLYRRLLDSRFGRVIEAIRQNESRTEAIGFPAYRFKLVCFVIAGAAAGLAGAMLANQSAFVSPKLMHWIQSGTLMIMVIVGGVGHRYGGVIGAAVLLVLEEVISGYTVHWQLWVGLILLAVVLFAPRGIGGWIDSLVHYVIRGRRGHGVSPQPAGARTRP